MAVFRVEKTHGYTVMSNYHLNDKNISLKSKGLLSQMLSLPESWDYTLRGLACINKESLDAIRTAVLELEQHGYISRRQGRTASGKLAGIEYTIYEQPQTQLPGGSSPCLENPNTDKPNTGNPVSDNPTQSITKEATTEISSTQPSIYPGQAAHLPSDYERQKIETMEAYRSIVYENIEFEHLCAKHKYDRTRLEEIADLIVDAVCSDKRTTRICGEDKPTEIVRSRFLKLGSEHIEYVFECLDNNTTKIHNMKSYLLTTLYNAPLTMDSYYQNAVNHDLYGGG